MIEGKALPALNHSILEGGPLEGMIVPEEQVSPDKEKLRVHKQIVLLKQNSSRKGPKLASVCRSTNSRAKLVVAAGWLALASNCSAVIALCIFFSNQVLDEKSPMARGAPR